MANRTTPPGTAPRVGSILQDLERADALLEATGRLRQRAEELHHELDAGSPQGEGADACSIVMWMEPGDFQMARRAHRALQCYLGRGLGGCGVLDAPGAVEFFNLLSEYCSRFSGWYYEEGSWRIRHDGEVIAEEYTTGPAPRWSQPSGERDALNVRRVAVEQSL